MIKIEEKNKYKLYSEELWNQENNTSLNKLKYKVKDFIFKSRKLKMNMQYAVRELVQIGK